MSDLKYKPINEKIRGDTIVGVVYSAAAERAINASVKVANITANVSYAPRPIGYMVSVGSNENDTSSLGKEAKS